MPSRPDDPTLGVPTLAITPAPASTTIERDRGAFAPGSIVAGRYRLVALLGRGGMGEVYRADDLTLDQPVALKFLPREVSSESGRLAQFHNELRVARQVSHKNVVRLYDIGEADGRPFITMEYVDGEDLASLIRRIGRIPQDKAVEIARQLCAGALAAHERGVIHRDLKPANVMLDGEGNVRITDFGIAGAADDSAAVHAGTPQYMAPEQLAGKPASIRSDIYALGLILFEIFTGKRAFDAKTIADLRELHDTGTVTTPSAIVRDLDPAVERVILRCLEKDPERRPASALVVAAALPGSDPLAAALAAGETPSPELLVAAAETDAMPVGRALAVVLAAAVLVTVFVILAPRATMLALVPLDKPPIVLADRAETLAAGLGYPKQTDFVYQFRLAPDPIAWIERTSAAPDRWRVLSTGVPPALTFWYRSSPRDLIPLRVTTGVTPGDPPETISGMWSVIVDAHGRLLEFHAVPPQVDDSSGPPPALDWQPLFSAAGLSVDAFRQTEPQWTPRTFADTRAAWEGTYPGRSDLPLRVEAAAYRGKPVSFYLVAPWTRPSQMTPAARTRREAILGSFGIVTGSLMLLAAVLLARHNLRANRADRKAAARLGVLMVVLSVFMWLVENHHTVEITAEFSEFFTMLGAAAFSGGTLWVLYLALEPYARRLWPDGLLGWTRLLSGRVRDSRVGREILYGVAFGAAISLIELGRYLVPPMFGLPMPTPAMGPSTLALMGPSHIVGQIGNIVYGPLQTSLFIALLFIGLRFLLRSSIGAAAASAVLLTVVGDQGRALANGLTMSTAFDFAVFAVLVFAIVRWGLLITTVALVVNNLITTVPFPSHLSSWAGATATWTLVLLAALTVFGFSAARAGKPLFGGLMEMAER